MYVPRDEAFGEEKQLHFTTTTASSGLKTVIQVIDAALIDSNLGFQRFSEIDSLFKEGFTLPPLHNYSHKNNNDHHLLQSLIPKVLKAVSDTTQVLRFETPETINSKFIYI